MNLCNLELEERMAKVLLEYPVDKWGNEELRTIVPRKLELETDGRSYPQMDGVPWRQEGSGSSKNPCGHRV